MNDDAVDVAKIYENKYDVEDHMNDIDPSHSLIHSPSSPSPSKVESLTNTPIVEVDTSSLDWDNTRYRSNTLDLSGEQAIINIYKRRVTLSNDETLSKSVINLKAEALQAELWYANC